MTNTPNDGGRTPPNSPASAPQERLEALLPCPFCGSAEYVRVISENGQFTVACDARGSCASKDRGCGAACGFFDAEHEVRSAWNRRAALRESLDGEGDLAKAERRSRDQRAMGWDAICNVLFELRPEWVDGKGTGIECAVAVIREALSTPRAAEAEWLRAMLHEGVPEAVARKVVAIITGDI